MSETELDNLKEEAKVVSNGWLTFKLGWQFAWAEVSFVGGPYVNYIPLLENNRHLKPLGCNLKKENPHDELKGVQVYIPIPDYGVPKRLGGYLEPESGLTLGALYDCITAAIEGRLVCIGCAGGMGRTGLMLSMIHAILKNECNSVEYVRCHYHPHAVETLHQKTYVEEFAAGKARKRLRKIIMMFAWKRYLLQLIKRG